MAATISEQPTLAVTRRDVALPEFATESGGMLAEWDYDEMPNGAILTTSPVAGVKQEPWQLVVLTNWQQMLTRRSKGATPP